MGLIPASDVDFARLIQDYLLVWLRRGEFRVILAQPPFEPSGEARITPVARPLLRLKRGRRRAGGLVSWPHLGLEAIPTPCLTIVLEGVADLTVGVTESTARETGGNVQNGLYHIRLPERHLLVYPANVPLQDGHRPHWQTEGEEQPDTTILWLDVIPEGVVLHTCHTSNGTHVLGPYHFVIDSRLPLLFDYLIEELQLGSTAPDFRDNSMEVAHSWLYGLLLRLQRSLAQQKALTTGSKILAKETPVESEFAENSVTVQRARTFIQGRLAQRLTVAKISSHTLVSPTQLNLLFRTELGQSVMEYVNHQRLQLAKSLLVETNLPVKIIGQNAGMPSAANFSRTFREKTGHTPQQYRAQQRENSTPGAATQIR